jgi:hypothetical protein
MNRCLTTFESRCWFPIPTPGSLTFMTSSRSSSTSRSNSTAVSRVLIVSFYAPEYKQMKEDILPDLILLMVLDRLG